MILVYKKSIETKNSIIEATKKLILEKSWEEITVREIAKEANINNPLIYYYFNNKQEIADTAYATMALKCIDYSYKLVPFEEDMLLNHFIHAILTFKCIFEDPVYNKLFMEAINIRYNAPQITEYFELGTIFEEQFSSIFNYYETNLDSKYVRAYSLSTYAVSVSLYKNILCHALDFTFEETIMFVNRFWIVNVGIDENEFNKKITKALSICRDIDIMSIDH